MEENVRKGGEVVGVRVKKGEDVGTGSSVLQGDAQAGFEAVTEDEKEA